MNEDDDFTFCQVAPTGEPSASGVIHLAHAVSRMSIGEDSSHIPSGGDKNLSPLWMDKLEDGSASASANQSVFGSLTFNVGEGKFKAPPSEENTSVGRKAAPRAKVPFEKGYSQMDWLKLTRTHPDLAGLKGSSNRRLISMDEVRQHQMEGSMWTVLKGRVYNVSPYLKFHPGGVDMLMKAIGKDCTSLFNKYHAWVNAEFLLEKCLVGMLDDSKK